MERSGSPGWVFLAFAFPWLGLTAHSGWIRYHEYKGGHAFEKIQVPDELALAQIDPSPWIDPVERENIAEGKYHFGIASRAGLFANGDSLSKLAWFEYLSGNANESVDLLRRAADHSKTEARALSLYYRGSILNLMGQYEEARASLDAALAEREDLILARQEKGESLWQMGRKEEAINVWADAIQRNPNLALATNLIAAAERSLGRVDEAATYEAQADRVTPDNAMYHWMLGRRLKNLGMNDLAAKHFQRALQLDPTLQRSD